ncbi:MAG: ABC-2 transporter permease [Eubacterium sp.]|jgi:ABC-2 type transport system permease protein|nr:ABC-2 transporter permease [Eubacterium sp.]
MKGLIRNSFYAMENSLKISFFIAAFLSVMPCFAKNSSLIPVTISVQIYIFAMSIGTSLHADAAAKWDQFEITLPVPRNGIVKAKYIFYLLLMAAGLCMGSLTAAVSAAAGLPLDYLGLAYGFAHGLTLSAVSIGLMYPVMLKFGTDKNEMVLLLSAFCAVAFTIAAAAVLSPWTNGMNLHHPLTFTVFTLAAILIFAASYLLSVRIHRKKEF